MWGQFDHRAFIEVPQDGRAVWHASLETFKAGIGMFCESYFLFAIGNILPIWQLLYPTCYSNAGCLRASAAGTYVEVAALIVGMMMFGLLAGRLGRLWGSRSTAALMLIGGVVIVAAYGPTTTDQFIMLNAGLAVFSLGVGGEYPLAASSAAERAEAGLPSQRGRVMVLTFALQGWGNVVNTAVICLLLAITQTSSCLLTSTTCSAEGLQITWRLQYGLGLVIVVGMVYVRQEHLRESKLWLERQKEIACMPVRDHQLELHERVRVLLSAEYSSRLLASAGCWYLWNLAFYGTKLFQSTIITVTLGGSPTLIEVMQLTLLNSFIGLLGYYAAALTVDSPWLGRTRMQGMGFFMTAVLFLLCGFLFETLTEPQNIGVFQFLYLLSSFFAQFGANATTWLIPCEIFPTDTRSESHGFAASSGKFGALTASLVFAFAGPNSTPVSAQVIFWVGGFACIGGLVLTVLFIPNTTGVTLHDVDRKWEARLLGRPYVGPASYGSNLSYFEAWLGLAVDPQSDAAQKARAALDGGGERQESLSQM